MKKIMNVRLALLLPALALLFTGCVTEDDLVQVNPNEDSEGSFWKTDADALRGVNAAYAVLLVDGGYMRCTQILLDGKSDDARSNSPWPAMANAGRFNSNVANSEIYGWSFEVYYQGVYRANQVLEFVPQMEFEDEELRTRILGQAYFLRGLYFFHLVNLFKNVPLPLDRTNIYSPQKTQEEGWAQVKSDFEMAAEMLPVSYDDVTGIDHDVEFKGRATKGAALGYLGKAQLFTQDYTAAKTTFESVMNLGVYSLVANYKDNFTVSNENNSESLFEVQFSREAGGVELGWGGIPIPGWGKTSARGITYAPRDFGWTDMQPTRALFDDYHLEATVDGEIDPRLDVTMFYNKPGGMTLYGQDFATFYANNLTNLNDLFCAKYQNADGTYANEMDWRSGINERLLRYADILLMYAECLNETGATAQAYQYIQMVRDRVNLPDLSTAHPGMSQAQMREQLAHERLLEFSLEGHRFDDIRRWGWLADPAKLLWLKSRDAEFTDYIPGREYFPIPQTEMDTNPGTIQNPSY